MAIYNAERKSGGRSSGTESVTQVDLIVDASIPVLAEGSPFHAPFSFATNTKSAQEGHSGGGERERQRRRQSVS